MLFNSSVFLVFFAAVYAAYLLLRRHHRLQNRLLLVASYVFYGWWDWRFLSLIVFSTCVDYVVGQRVHESEDERVRRRWLWVSVGTNLGLLAVFKYLGFFVDSAVALAAQLGWENAAPSLAIVLPVGISFYTFQTLSYTIDIHRRKLEPTRDVLDFALFVAFFPQLVAGPIERASAFLPQIAKPRKLDIAQVQLGLHLVVSGLAKKVLIADNAAVVSNQVFNGYTEYGGLDLLLGALAFTLQIYGDFSGYSDIARGLAKMMGFELMLNFRLPYFAVSPSDFWRRWHISLSSWLRDYLYISLGGNRGGAWKTYRNLSLTMLLGGLWHGAAWNFVLWGAFHGAILVVYRVVPWLSRDPKLRLQGGEFALWGVRWAVMFALTVIGWVLFRAESWDQIVWWFSHVGLQPSGESFGFIRTLVLYGGPLALVQLLQGASGDLSWPARRGPVLFGLWLAALIVGILVFGQRASSEFIYFQF